jgi:hypothetical protein
MLTATARALCAAATIVLASAAGKADAASLRFGASSFGFATPGMSYSWPGAGTWGYAGGPGDLLGWWAFDLSQIEGITAATVRFASTKNHGATLNLFDASDASLPIPAGYAYERETWKSVMSQSSRSLGSWPISAGPSPQVHYFSLENELGAIQAREGSIFVIGFRPTGGDSLMLHLPYIQLETIPVSTLPLPAGAWLFLSGIVGLLGFGGASQVAGTADSKSGLVKV